MYYRQLGYDEYDDYLSGREWAAIKRLKYEKTKHYRCELCFQPKNLLLHKRSYDYLTPEEYRRHPKLLKSLLVYLCFDCNELVHFYWNGDKVPLDEATLRRRERSVKSKPSRILMRLIRRFT